MTFLSNIQKTLHFLHFSKSVLKKLPKDSEYTTLNDFSFKYSENIAFSPFPQKCLEEAS